MKRGASRTSRPGREEGVRHRAARHPRHSVPVPSRSRASESRPCCHAEASAAWTRRARQDHEARDGQRTRPALATPTRPGARSSKGRIASKDGHDHASCCLAYRGCRSFGHGLRGRARLPQSAGCLRWRFARSTPSHHAAGLRAGRGPGLGLRMRSDTAPQRSGQPSYLDGRLLVAMPSMGDSRFNRSVIYLCAHSNDGAMGIVIIREPRSSTSPIC